MKLVFSWIAFAAVNLVGVYFLLAILLFVDTYVNDGFIPISGMTDRIRFVFARGFLLLIESVVWLVPMAYGNFLILSGILKVKSPKKFVALVFAVEFGLLCAIIALFMYGVFTRMP